MCFYSLDAELPSRQARSGERLVAETLESGHTVLRGWRGDITCLPARCKLEVLASAESVHPVVRQMLPGHTLRFRQVHAGLNPGDWLIFPKPSVQFRLESPWRWLWAKMRPSPRVLLRECVGFQFQLAPEVRGAPPREEELLYRLRIRQIAESVLRAD